MSSKMKPRFKTDIKLLTQGQMISWLGQRKIASYRAAQIFRWIYQHQADSFAEMTNIGKDCRELLASHFSIQRLEKVRVESSRDGSRKYLFRLHDGEHIESVLIPEKDHHTLCISVQAGCAQGCRFCLTAKDGFRRNLTSGEIIAQIRDIANEIQENIPAQNPPAGVSGATSLTNIVLMGMGEPLANYENVIRALDIIANRDFGLCFSNRRITLSTAGLISRFSNLCRDTKINLAVSLNASDNATRDRLMPINRKYPLEKLIEACRQYKLSPRQRITFEYILMKGVNDSPEDAGSLAKLLRPVKAKINLIPFNEYEGSEFERPDESVIQGFRETLIQHNYTVIIRRSKGQDISAACGQLRSGKRCQGNNLQNCSASVSGKVYGP